MITKISCIPFFNGRDDENFKYVAAWEYKGEPSDAVLHKEDLEFKDIELKQRSYK